MHTPPPGVMVRGESPDEELERETSELVTMKSLAEAEEADQADAAAAAAAAAGDDGGRRTGDLDMSI